MTIPVRWQVVPHDEGHDRIVVHINGRVSMILDWDPAGHVLTEVPLPFDLTPAPPAAHRHPLDGIETKAGPLDRDH